MQKYYPCQVNFTSAEERREFQAFCKEHFGRPFSTQVRRMLQQAKREAQEQPKRDAA